MKPNYPIKLDEELDMEWTSLILLSRKMGITIEEIRDFLRKSQLKETGTANE